MEDNVNQFPDEPEVIEDSTQQDDDDSSSEESEGSDAQEGEQEVQQAAPKRPKISAQTRINQITREKFQALEIAERMRQENEQLQQEMMRLHTKTEASTKAAMAQYTSATELRLQQAKQSFKQAYESGDIDAQADAQAKIAEVSSEMQQVKAWEAEDNWNKQQQAQIQQQQHYQQPQQMQPQQYQQPYEAAPIVTPESQMWMESNPWLAEDNADHNPELAERVMQYSDQLDNYLYQNGQGNKIGRAEYFNAINAHIREITGTPQRRALPMKASRTPVGGVRSNSGYVNGQRQSKELPAEHQEMMKHWKVNEQEAKLYRKEYQDDITNGRASWGR